MDKFFKREVITSDAQLHIRESKDGTESRTIAGYAILFNQRSAPLYQDDKVKVVEIIDSSAVTRDLLDESDIKFTMFHDRQIILARSNKGKGTLKYDIDEKGVSFEFEAPKTIYGDYALDAVRNGYISGCSFAFSTPYLNEDYVEFSVEAEDGKRVEIYRVKKITGIYDMTLASDPAYPQTSVENRSLGDDIGDRIKQQRNNAGKIAAQLREMKAEINKQDII